MIRSVRGLLIALALGVGWTLPGLDVAAAKRPNVLLIVTDDQRANGTIDFMPETRKLFHEQGVMFRNAVATTPNCCPSRASIMSGRYMHNHGVLHNRDNQAELAQLDFESLIANQLGESGYRTGLVGKFLNGWNLATPPPDYDQFAMSLGGFYGTDWNINGDMRHVERYSTDVVGAQARKFIQDAEGKDREPWFLMVAPFAPHGTLGPDGVRLEPAHRHEDAEVGALRENPSRLETSPQALLDKPPFWRNLVSSYRPGPGAPTAGEARTGQLRMLLAVDEAVASIYEKLRSTEEERRTFAIYMSDNGLFWGEHGAPPIKDMPYGPAVKIPMMMRWPGELGPSEDSRLAANIDIAPTILDAAEITPSSSVDGRSLLEPWQRESILLEYAGMGPIPDWASLYSPRVSQYSEYYTASGAVNFREYTDFESDPYQLENPLVDNDPLNNPDVAGLSARLRAALQCEANTCP